MPTGPKGEKRPADVIGNAIKVKVRNVNAKRVQVDEIWSFTAAKQKNVAWMKKPIDGAGDTWTWTAIEARTKLLISHFVGGRDGDCAAWFIQDVADRVANRIQLTSDGHKAYLDAVEGAFGAEIDYAMLIKIYGASSDGTKGRYSPAECIGAQKHRRATSRSTGALARARDFSDNGWIAFAAEEASRRRWKLMGWESCTQGRWCPLCAEPLSIAKPLS